MADRRLKIAKFPILALASIAGFGFGFASALAQQPGFINCYSRLSRPGISSAQRLTQATGRDANTEIGQEMGLLAELTVSNPDALSSRATLCISDVPSPASQQAQIIQQSAQQPAQQAQPQGQYQQAAPSPAQPVSQAAAQPQQDKPKRRRFSLFGR